MKTKIFLSFLIIFFILFMFFLGLNKSNKYDTKALIGQKIVDFEIDSLIEQSKISQDNLKKNKFTLINFWASWCAPCRLEHPYLLMIKKNSKIEILGVNFKDDKENALEFMESFGNPYTLLAQDKNGTISIRFGIYGIPESILLDKNKIIVKKYIGPIDAGAYKEIINIINNQ